MIKYSDLVIQDGPVREVGVNGDQIEDILSFVVEFLKSVNVTPIR
jgi:hypothetical protein